MTTNRPHFRNHLLAAPLLAALLGSGLVACGDDADDATATESAANVVVVADAWVREPAEGQTNSAVYASITNGAGSEITLVGAAVPVAATVELHETTMADDGAMWMSEREGGFAIADGETFTLEPGGPHVMLFDIDRSQFDGDLDVTFLFDGAEPVTATAELRAISGDAMGDTDMGDDEMDGESDDEMDSESEGGGG